ncbi:MAG TPA: hypothetical protein VFE05_20360 [Longimicrobiaceae bacterium]|jgi:hypothetical protein|nr:hypothetical protein [Longimicrobiaceae bacterium]
MRHALLSATMLLVSGGCRLQAQDVDPPEWVAPGYLTHAAPISQAQARTRCPAVSSAGCRPVEMADLGMAGGRRWSVGIYQTIIADTFPDPTTKDTVIYSRQEETLVVYSAARAGGVLRPEWQGVYWPTWFADVIPEIGDAPGGGAMLALTVCWNGTAGCTSQFLKIRRADGWHAVRQQWAAGLPRRLRPFARGAFVAPKTLTAKTGLWHGRTFESPTRLHWLIARLGWRGTRTLVLRSYRVTARDPFTAASYVSWRKSERNYHSEMRPLHPRRTTTRPRGR